MNCSLWMCHASDRQSIFWSWSLRHLYGIGAFYDISKYEAPYYFEVALRYGCCESTVRSGFKATGLFPFQSDWVEENREKFTLADTLDQEKMEAKMAAAGVTLTFADSYKSFVQLSDAVGVEIQKAGDELNLKFPALAAALHNQQQFRPKHEESLQKTSELFRIPDSCKRKRTRRTTNKIGELWGKSRVANKLARIEELEKHKAAVDIERRAKEQQKEALQKQKAEQKATKENAKRAKKENDAPVLVWLKNKGYCPADTTALKNHSLSLRL